MDGGPGADNLGGGYGNDTIRGGSDNDVLWGDHDNDALYGGTGADQLFGWTGNDALFGGIGQIDTLVGHAGSDRFLNHGNGMEDVISDLAAEDARIRFRNGAPVTVNFSGQNGTYTFGAGYWSDTEIENADTAFRIAHDATGNARLLKRQDRSELTFVRQGAGVSSTGGTFTAAAWNTNGVISVVSLTTRTLLHEIGHNWDREFNADGWRNLSGWTQTNMQANANYQMGTGNDGWWHQRTAQFASAYARTNPEEDFAESFAANMLNRARLANAYTVVVAKDNFVNNMVTNLATNS
jgi:Ca2+-binding RTX toxin-like protein